MGLWRYLLLGSIEGAFAWSAYAVLEFIVSSVFGLARPYSILTPWHWQLTGLLIIAYVVTGLVSGALAGLVLYVLRISTRWIQNADTTAVLEAGGAFTLVITFSSNVLAYPSIENGQIVLFCVGLLFAAFLVASIHSGKHAERLGYLTNPWITAGLLLGLGQVFGFVKLKEDGSPVGGKVMVLAAGLTFALVAVALVSVFLGRHLRSRSSRRPLGSLGPAGVALGLAAALLLVCLWLGRPGHAAAEASAAGSTHFAQPNLVIVVLDTVRADHLSLYGYPRRTTPHIEALAHDSVVYTNAIAPSDMTLSSHGSLFTGLYAGWHGAHCRPPSASYGSSLNRDVHTLAEILAGKSYSTTGVSANLYLRENFGLQKGFQAFRIPRPVPILSAESWYLLRRSMRRGLTHFVDTAQFDRLFARSEDVNRVAFGLMDEDKLNRGPFFLFMNYMDAHFPYVPPSPFDSLFPGKLRSLTQDDLTAIQESVIRGATMTEDDHEHFMSQYDGGIAYDDAHVGQVVRWLKRRGLYDNTMIVVASDHGEQFGEKNLVLHANSIYQNLLHVALVVKYPKSARTGVVNDPVSLVDVAPTALAALGYPVPKQMQGRDLLAPGPLSPRQLYGESYPCPALHRSDCPPEGCLTRAVFSWPFKYTASSNGRREFFNLATDPGEDHNAVASQPDAAKELGAELGRWTKTIPATSAQRSNVGGEALQQLKSLGYVQ